MKTFQLTKIYASGGAVEVRVIAKPVAGTVVVDKNGVAATGWTVDAAAGLVTFTAAPANGVVLTADFEFDVPARFDLFSGRWARWTSPPKPAISPSLAQIPVEELRL